MGTVPYAQAMVSDITHWFGFRNMGIYVYDSEKESAESFSSRYDGIISSIPSDIIFFQHPETADKIRTVMEEKYRRLAENTRNIGDLIRGDLHQEDVGGHCQLCDTGL